MAVGFDGHGPRRAPQVASEARDRLWESPPAGPGRVLRDAGGLPGRMPASPPRRRHGPHGRTTPASDRDVRRADLESGGPELVKIALAVRSPSLARAHPEGRPLRSACTALIAAQDPASDADPRSGRRAHLGLCIIGLVPLSDYA